MLPLFSLKIDRGGCFFFNEERNEMLSNIVINVATIYQDQGISKNP